MQGSDGQDVLQGGAGDDGLYGGAGTDMASYAAAIAGVTVSLVPSGAQDTHGAGNDTLIDIEGLIGSSYADTLTGDDSANSLSGGAGNDLLVGGLGDDRLDGGAGIDTVGYETAAAGVTADLAAGIATGGAGSDTLVLIENLTGSAFADTLTGNGFANILTGSAGDDVLDGGLGNDMLIGGDGIDTASYASAAGAVKVSLAITGAQSTGSAGSDTLSGIETLIGSAYGDQLTGDAGSNSLIGNAGNDILKGAAGADMLTGGADADRFVYTATGDSMVAASDHITDFASGDILDVSAIDANATIAGNQAFLQATAFTHSAGEYTLAYDSGTNTTTALFDTNGDANADMAILFTGDVTALASSFVL
jgi:Ca2+-binding RTX toxin-like protein